jgi:hypothetical protein
MRGGPPRPGAPGVLTPGRRRSTSPTLASPNLSISSRPMTIYAAVLWRRSSTSAVRPPVISMRWASAGAAAAGRGRAAGAEAGRAAGCAVGAEAARGGG